MDCIFCKIVKGEIPSTKVYEDEKVLAFMDINPMNDGHLLVIPKGHAPTIGDISNQDFSVLMSKVHTLAGAVKRALTPDGITLVQLNGEASGQEVPHLHVHIIPRHKGDRVSIGRWQLTPGDMNYIQQIAAKISNELN